ncbi:MAG: bifunctional 3,4-dihydroxy-2-butanone-4-phosphate synthase/GTP cyclohydrolase II [Patescibacteria group bacterium]
MKFNTIEEAVADLARGKMVVLCDDEDRENEGDLVCAGSHVSPAVINFMLKHGRGLICAPIDDSRAARLKLPLMASDQEDRMLAHCNFTVSVDARRGVTTGISAADRAQAVKTLLNPKSKSHDLVRPGHMFPLIGRHGGVLVRTGHTEGSLDLMRLAGLPEVAVICEILDDDGTMLRGKRLMEFTKKHELKIITIKDLIHYRRMREKLIYRAVESTLPTEYGEFQMIVYKTKIDDYEHIALVRGTIKKGDIVPTRVHSECITGEVFHSRKCDCRAQLDTALKYIASKGSGVLIYMRQEGRGIGLVNKLKAYNLQDSQGLDTVEANAKLGFKADLREYGIGAQILADIGLSEIALMTNNPKKIVGLEGYGLKIVDRIPLEIRPDDRTRRYLATKKKKMGHMLKFV